MVNLDSLPPPILTLVRELTPPLDERTFLDWYRQEREAHSPHTDVVALASEQGPEGRAPPDHLSHACIFALSPSLFKWTTKALESMPSLEIVEYASSLPFPPALVDVLKRSSTFHKLYFYFGGCESLPHVLPLADKLTAVEIAPTSMRHGLPSRSRKPPSAFVAGLIPFLLAAKDKLEYLSINTEGLEDVRGGKFCAGNTWFQQVFDGMVDVNRAYPKFPKLEHLALKHVEGGLALKHLLNSSGKNLTHLEITTSSDTKSLAPPKEPFYRLRMLLYILGDNVSCGPFVKKALQDVPLREYASPRLLQPSPQRTDAPCSSFRAIVAGCPNVELLMVKADWSGEALDYLSALSPLYKLRSFTFDHPFTRPRDSPFSEPDGRTIWSERNGDFRVVSVMAGQSVEEVVRGRIQADLNAVKPIYTKHFTSLARSLPSLERLCWSATEKVKWKWEFFRDAVEVNGKKAVRIRFKQNAEIDYPEMGEVMERTAVLALSRREE
ncbi:hypothetical protein JCM8547_004759 [Rhodosporidiobolus lusitaniae]